LFPAAYDGVVGVTAVDRHHHALAAGLALLESRSAEFDLVFHGGSGTPVEVNVASSTAPSTLPKNPTPTGWPISGAPGGTLRLRLIFVQFA
jgi:hypothetical protein